MRGFTLIETLIYLALVAMLITGTVVSIIAVMDTAYTTRITTEVLQERVFTHNQTLWLP